MESVETLNQRLIEHFGIDTITGQAMFRIVWANEQTEKRLVDETDSGVELLFPEVREVRKYPYLVGLWVLERLVLVPEIQQRELPMSVMSYEPVWAYRDANDNPVTPYWDATKFVVDVIYAASGKTSMRKYVEDEKFTTQEGKEERVREIQLELFGNETDTCDALRYKEGIVVPHNYTKES